MIVSYGLSALQALRQQLHLRLQHQFSLHHTRRLSHPRLLLPLQNLLPLLPGFPWHRIQLHLPSLHHLRL
jgi:hypothetical protein